MFCRVCGKQVVEQAVVCPGCGSPPRTAQGTYCWSCGTQVVPTAVACVKCGAGQPAANPLGIPGLGPGQLKSRLVAGVLNLICIVGLPIGGLGRLYLGYIGIGVAQLLLSLVCIGYIWSIIDGIMILTGSVDRDAQGQPLGQ